MTDACLLVFARAPVPGAVKTRLIPALGADGAAALYARLLERTLTTAAAARYDATQIWIDGTPEHACFAAWRERPGWSLQAQCGGDLGARMAHALDCALQQARHAVLIGSDVPSLSAADLVEARVALEQGADVVLAPTEDGGYGLVGLTAPSRAIFDGIAWSTAAVMPETRRRLASLGLRWHELAVQWDVDRVEDIVRFDALAGAGRGA